jgi:AmpD protein
MANTFAIDNIPYHPSPNADERPVGVEVNLLVIHGISLPPREFGGDAIDQLFMNKLDFEAHPYFQAINNLHVSTHVLIRRDGSMIQYVPFSKRAWHAGQSSFAEKKNCNDFSIGIELEGADDIPYTTPQYQQLALLTKTLMVQYPALTTERIVGHSDIAPGRKTDPGPAFSWNYYRRLLET